MSTEEANAIILRRLGQVMDRLDTIAPTGPPRLLTMQEAAAALGVSRDTVRRLCDRRELRYVQAGPSTAKRIPQADLQKWIDRHSVAPLRR